MNLSLSPSYETCLDFGVLICVVPLLPPVDSLEIKRYVVRLQSSVFLPPVMNLEVAVAGDAKNLEFLNLQWIRVLDLSSSHDLTGSVMMERPRDIDIANFSGTGIQGVNAKWFHSITVDLTSTPNYSPPQIHTNAKECPATPDPCFIASTEGRKVTVKARGKIDGTAYFDICQPGHHGLAHHCFPCDDGSYTIYNGQLSCTACSPFVWLEGSPVSCFVDVMQISASIILVLISVLFIMVMGPQAYCSHKGLPVGTCCAVEDIGQQDLCGDRMHLCISIANPRRVMHHHRFAKSCCQWSPSGKPATRGWTANSSESVPSICGSLSCWTFKHARRYILMLAHRRVFCTWRWALLCTGTVAPIPDGIIGCIMLAMVGGFCIVDGYHRVLGSPVRAVAVVFVGMLIGMVCKWCKRRTLRPPRTGRTSGACILSFAALTEDPFAGSRLASSRSSTIVSTALHRGGRCTSSCQTSSAR